MGFTRDQQCIFCPNQADSKEHIWSDWILKILPPSKNGRFFQQLADGSERSWHQEKPDWRTKVVCENACNNGWMSARLEEPMRLATKDILIHQKMKVFSASECASIAAWAFKTTILANHMGLREEPYFSQEQRYAFARDLTIPKGVQVWLSRRDAGFLTTTFRSAHRTTRGRPSPHLINPPRSPYGFELYDCIFSVGYLLLQVVAARWTEREVANCLDFPPISQAHAANEYAIPIWPNDGFSVRWPPPLAIGNDLIETFWDRFEGFAIPRSMMP